MNLKYIFSFLAGASIGAVASYFIFNKRMESKYSKIADEEINSVKEKFSNKKTSNIGQVLSEINRNKPNLETISKLSIRMNGNDDIEEVTIDGASSIDDEMPLIYLIDQDSFGEDEGRSAISMTYYSDGILAEDIDMSIVNPGELIGDDLFKSFLEPEFLYGSRVIYVRNDILNEDYEITGTTEAYSDICQGSEG